MKPGWKTSEFWLTIAAVVVSNIQAYVSDGITWEEALLIASGILTALGYSVSRGLAKRG